MAAGLPRGCDRFSPRPGLTSFFAAPCSAHEKRASWRASASKAVVDPDLGEWNYGEYEGLTPEEIHKVAPGWLIFRDGCPGGETPEQVGARIDRVIARSRAVGGDVALFAHGHVLRVLAARWIGLPAGGGEHFLLDTGTLCVLGYYRDVPALRIWNGPLVDQSAATAARSLSRPEQQTCDYARPV